MTNDVKLPSCGRAVHVFPNAVLGQSKLNIPPVAMRDQDKLPGIVVSSDGLTINVSVFTHHPRFAAVPCDNVKHKSESEAGQPYWDWPAMV